MIHFRRLLAAGLVGSLCSLPATAEFRAGAAAIDASPTRFPVIVNGGFLPQTADSVQTPLHARALVMDDGRLRLAIVVVDTCMMPRDLIDAAKQEAARRVAIPPERMLVAATHTHSAPSCMGALGTEADPAYVPFLRQKVVEAIVAAEANLEPARAGWGRADAGEFTAVRRWIRRPDRIENDPFGNPTVRANMHAATNWDHVTGPSGPEDPELSLLSIQSRDGRPLAVLANFSMHYFSDTPISADYFGLFCEGLKARVDRSGDHPPFVGLLSHGCSGDIWRRDYAKPPGERGDDTSIGDYTDGLLELAMTAYDGIAYQDNPDLAMAESRLPLSYRIPDQQRLEWARRVVAEMDGPLPANKTEVYAREQIILHERRATEVVVQALRIGDMAVATTPTETYALTGLKIKLQSPLENTMVLDLANGGDGYIPPPEQHVLGGYNTWPARSAGLEVQAEPKICEAVLQLLETTTSRPRRVFRQSRGPGALTLLEANPAAYWRLDDFAGPVARDASPHGRDAIYEPGVVFFLPGPQPEAFCTRGEANRAAHFAGGRLRARLPGLGDRYSVSLWFWNGMPPGARPVTGWMFSRGHDHGPDAHGDHLGLSGAGDTPGRLMFLHGDESRGAKPLLGRTPIPRWAWNHVRLVRDGPSVRVFLNGDDTPEIDGQVSAGAAPAPTSSSSAAATTTTPTGRDGSTRSRCSRRRQAPPTHNQPGASRTDRFRPGRRYHEWQGHETPDPHRSPPRSDPPRGSGHRDLHRHRPLPGQHGARGPSRPHSGRRHPLRKQPRLRHPPAHRHPLPLRPRRLGVGGRHRTQRQPAQRLRHFRAAG